MNHLDREGIFQAVPREWWIRKADSGAIAVSFDFDIVAQFDGTDWHDWRQYGQWTVFGDYWVVKRDGGINLGTVEQLANSLGWDGNLASVRDTPPNYLVQITVKAETYEGKTRYKAGWMNPGDHVPGPSGASPAEVQQAANQFGSLLRAAAGAAKKAKPVQAPALATVPSTATPPGPANPPAGPLGPEPPQQTDDDMSF